jgi:hypothetical protein
MMVRSYSKLLNATETTFASNVMRQQSEAKERCPDLNTLNITACGGRQLYVALKERDFVAFPLRSCS